ncbi:unnamed protein product [Sphagnum jensenii]|uniref:Uncharacterized protein n=1 Tax=Sphagnum jensenii TaxID=128206 RepID=A0ABP1AL75_9BRYO
MLVPFYPIARRLKKEDDSRVEIDYNAAGILLVEAEAGVRELSDIGEFAPDPRFQQVVPQINYSCDITSYPLLVLQVTFFKCGGVLLGVGMQHHISDGTSGIHFINLWSDMVRGIPIGVPPCINYNLLKARSPPVPKIHHIEYQAPPRLISTEGATETTNRAGNKDQEQSHGKVSFCCNASFDAVLLVRLSEGGIVLSMSVFLNLKTTYKDGAKL